MSARRASPLAAAFLWAAAMTAGYGLVDALVFHAPRQQITSDTGTAAGGALVVAYSERKYAQEPE